jgi:hypothetical protein
MNRQEADKKVGVSKQQVKNQDVNKSPFKRMATTIDQGFTMKPAAVSVPEIKVHPRTRISNGSDKGCRDSFSHQVEQFSNRQSDKNISCKSKWMLVGASACNERDVKQDDAIEGENWSKHSVLTSGMTTLAVRGS